METKRNLWKFERRGEDHIGGHGNEIVRVRKIEEIVEYRIGDHGNEENCIFI